KSLAGAEAPVPVSGVSLRCAPSTSETVVLSTTPGVGAKVTVNVADPPAGTLAEAGMTGNAAAWLLVARTVQGRLPVFVTTSRRVGAAASTHTVPNATPSGVWGALIAHEPTPVAASVTVVEPARIAADAEPASDGR